MDHPGVSRRQLLLGAGALAGAGACRPARSEFAASDWAQVRRQFRLSLDQVHLSTLFIASHPRPVREAIERHRLGLDEDPVGYLLAHDTPMRLEATREAASHFGADSGNIALTDSTTMGLGLLYNGLKLSASDQVLTEEGGYYSTWRSWDYQAQLRGVQTSQVRLFDEARGADEDQMVERLLGALTDRTRAVALTWVHSDSGIKLPVRRFADALAQESRRRGERIFLCLDGVHGYGVEDTTLGALGCDFFVAGCHKWLYGPRGTGVMIAAGRELFDSLVPTIPPFGARGSPGMVMTPGGFHSFEMRWALADAYRFHASIGQERITARIRALAGQLKEGLAATARVRLLTPPAPERSAGIVSFEVEGMSSARLVRALRARGLVLTRAPYGLQAARATPGYINTPEEIDRLLGAVRELAGG